MLVRVRMDLAYDGTEFHGWATQPSLRTVQGTLEAALATVLRVPEQRLVVAGRTDTGVHARGQVVHTDVDADVVAAAAGRALDPPLEALLRRLNGILPPDVRLHQIREVPQAFDARFSALWRRYAYRVADRATAVDPLTRGHVLTWAKPLNLEAMNEAAQPLLGLHDFAAFCKPREGATTVRTLLALQWERNDNGLATATVASDAFCHNMVRALMGCLLAVGDGRRPPEWPAEVLAAGVRDSAVTVAHAHALSLEEVGYPGADQLAQQSEATRRRRSIDD